MMDDWAAAVEVAFMIFRKKYIVPPVFEVGYKWESAFFLVDF